MQNYSDIKEKIIDTTITLIQSSDGLIENITIRAIAQKAQVSVGLVNYHFHSKKNLIEICVQRMISQVMKTFAEAEKLKSRQSQGGSESAGMASFIFGVFHFLIHNPEISKISILGDLSEPSANSNSSVSYRAIVKAIDKRESEDIGKIKAFMLLSTIQSAFLNRNITSELSNFNLNNKNEYESFFRLATEILNIK